MLGMIKTFTVYYQHPMGKDPWWFASSTYNSRHTGLSGQHQRSNQDSEISLRALTRGYACCQLLMWCALDRCSCTTFESWWCWGFEKNKGVESVYCFNFHFAVFRLMHTHVKTFHRKFQHNQKQLSKTQSSPIQFNDKLRITCVKYSALPVGLKQTYIYWSLTDQHLIMFVESVKSS